MRALVTISTALAIPAVWASVAFGDPTTGPDNSTSSTFARATPPDDPTGGAYTTPTLLFTPAAAVPTWNVRIITSLDIQGPTPVDKLASGACGANNCVGAEPGIGGELGLPGGFTFAAGTVWVGGDPVNYRGLEVGQVLGYDLSDADGGLTVQVFIKAPHDKLVRQGTRFWNVSGVTITAGSEGFKVKSDSVMSLLMGGIAFDVPPGAEPGTIAPSDESFTLYDDEAAADNAIFTRTVRLLLHFPDSVENLAPGAEVRMQGIEIGRVVGVHMEYDRATDRISVPVVIEIEADRVTLLHDPDVDKDFERRADETFGRFVARGLRAQLGTANLITGQKTINLDFVPDAPARQLIEGGAYPEIPTLPSDDFNALIASAKNVLGSMQKTVSALDLIVSSPALKRSLGSLDESLANVAQITHDVRAAGMGPLVTSLRATSDSANAAIAAAGGAIDGQGGDGSDLAGAIRELEAAAQSVRILADDIDAHPESVLRGRPKDATR